MGLTLLLKQDIQSHAPAEMAVSTTDTLEHDFCKTDKRVSVHNSCMDTTKNMNGILCNMHPSEGVWLFRGSYRNNCFGSMFGDYGTCGIFPTSAPKIKRQESLAALDSNCVVRLHSKPTKEHYMCFDESYFKVLENMQWNRDYGYVELMPIVVGLQ